MQRGVGNALASALREGRLAAAGLDMFAEDPPDPASLLLYLPDVIATPHCATTTMKGAERMAVSVAEDILGGLGRACRQAVVVNGISLTRR